MQAFFFPLEKRLAVYRNYHKEKRLAYHKSNPTD